MDKKYLKETEVSEITGLKVQTLRNHRHKRIGIPYIKIISSVRYLKDDVDEFMNKHKIETWAVKPKNINVWCKHYVPNDIFMDKYSADCSDCANNHNCPHDDKR